MFGRSKKMEGITMKNFNDFSLTRKGSEKELELHAFVTDRIHTICKKVEADHSTSQTYSKYLNLYDQIFDLCGENGMLDVLLEMDTLSLGLEAEKSYAVYWQAFEDASKASNVDKILELALKTSLK
jgi:hypothetical protein